MIEVLPVKDRSLLEELYLSAGQTVTKNSAAVSARCGTECLGYCLYELENGTLTVTRLEPETDAMLADGILRSALHAGIVAGASLARYDDTAPEKLLTELNFTGVSPHELKLEKLFEDCNCQKGR